MLQQRLAIVTFNFPPDFGAASFRMLSLVESIQKQASTRKIDLKITVVCAKPFRYKYNNKNEPGSSSPKHNLIRGLEDVDIVRLDVPMFGRGFVAESFSYLFFLIQALPVLIWNRPHLIFATSAKLLTSYLGALASLITGAILCVDIRDTFSENFLSFFRRQRKVLVYLILLYIENFVANRATSINLVSPGFSQLYDELLDSSKVSYFTNGVDEQFVEFYANSQHPSLKTFLNKTFNHTTNNTLVVRKTLDNKINSATLLEIDTVKQTNHTDKPKTILYAGNLGIGQDLLKLLEPLIEEKEIVEELIELKWSIKIMGDGAQAPALRELAKFPHLREIITVLRPIPRQELIREYGQIDALFLQVGSYRSLDMVIPSKIFEYAATGLPILAGVRGYTRDFIGQIPGVQFFTQKDIKSFLNQLKQIKTGWHNRDEFIEQYDRRNIMRKYADHLLSYIQASK
ncbi:hypothetical protein CEP10_05965 [Cylindrospermopsis raciborskii S07]|uniref:glycosyltransferase n=1 Tax=Cylindrospermopsis raciborskii TaxID=77022 RepID=UPI000C9E2A47|nr:glycosyltransferase [Cylindrospermopsis raciborskii]PNK02165.1 hypothetical protein CEP12_17345 [Cylindrospermopsis raciborskii S14]PNK02985.1 hypothetical protein CEP11_14395 [Cylindrospermopsis raciborskii S10]PNK09234.1 hypothetical protein CEP10_05965 [Cylindrospermopsis raciborskii S07]PNK13012.1 hypothetical protein CEP09_13585 [Cylindrospermopsis raciborskii S06]PNK18213.1 hypothetical protein CEP08_09305 [Cylindrospermopsis raciborskii S05]